MEIVRVESGMLGINGPDGHRISAEETTRLAKLFEAAPQMLEALRTAEWSGPRAFAGADSGPTCPWCHQPKPPKNHLANGHAGDCAWSAAIKAAGGGQ